MNSIEEELSKKIIEFDKNFIANHKVERQKLDWFIIFYLKFEFTLQYVGKILINSFYKKLKKAFII